MADPGVDFQVIFHERNMRGTWARERTPRSGCFSGGAHEDTQGVWVVAYLCQAGPGSSRTCELTGLRKHIHAYIYIYKDM